jgi:Fe-S-cluster containining protein
MNGFKRTVCACSECVACCKRQPGPLILADFQRIADFLGETPEQAKAHFKASRGSLIGYKGKIVRIGTITPKHDETGRCVFLDEKDRCKIHPVAPFGCAYFDTHMGRVEGDKRCRVAIMDHATPEYQKLRQEIDDDKSIASDTN